MKHSIAVFAATMLLSSAAYAYQVTGPVLEVTDTKIVVDKNGEKHEIARNKDTKGDKNIKKGDRVTVEYNMIATKIESKAATKDDKAKDAKKEEPKKEEPKKEEKAPVKK
jgi:phosphate-selective porin